MTSPAARSEAAAAGRRRRLTPESLPAVPPGEPGAPLRLVHDANAAPRPAYVLPLAGAGYDRTPALRASEVMALRAFADREDTRTRCARIAWEPALERLVRPLLDTAALHRVRSTRAQHTFERDFVRQMLLTMHRWHTLDGDPRAYWAWERDDWVRMCDAPAETRARLPGAAAKTSPALAAGAAAYLLCGVFIHGGGNNGPNVRLDTLRVARMIFGEHLEALYREVVRYQLAAGFAMHVGKRSSYLMGLLTLACEAGSPHPEHWRGEHVARAAAEPLMSKATRKRLKTVVAAVEGLGYRLGPVPARQAAAPTRVDACPAGVPEPWWRLSVRWAETTTLRASTRDGMLTAIHKFGRWLGIHHPAVLTVEAITRPLVAAYVASVINEWRVLDRYAGDAWADRALPRRGDPLEPAGIAGQIYATRRFLRDVSEWEWATLKVKLSAFAVPRHIRDAVRRDARDIDAPLFAKLIWASLNLMADDLAQQNVRLPLAYVRAVAVTWTHAALRSDELARLDVGCARFAVDWSAVPDGPFEAHEIPGVPATPAPGLDGSAGYLLVPDNKTSRSFVKAISPVVIRAIHAWERERPPGQPPVLDRTSRRRTHRLFSTRGVAASNAIVNRTIIPLLCAKMGVPESDARGRITSHRARHTIASLLLNAPEGMSHEELAAWLGHRDTKQTRRYARVTPAKQGERLERAAKNLVQVDVVLDLDAVAAGAVTRALLYDLGHGWCANKFFALCAHRMACARCTHYKPKPESGPALVQMQRNHKRLKEEIELRPEELAAMEGDDAAVDKLRESLREVPTPDGRTPHAIDLERAAESARSS